MRFRGGPGAGELVLAFTLLGLASCGAGVAGVVASAGGSGGGGNAPPALTAFEVLGSKVSPASLRLVVSDPEGDPVEVGLYFASGGRPETAMTALDGPGVMGNEVRLPSSSVGTETVLAWDFAAELGDSSFVPAVDLVVKQEGGSALSGGTLRVGIGNDAPVVTSLVAVPTDLQDPTESAGIVELRLAVEDSSSDVVSLAMEWRRADDPPDAWLPATAAGVFPEGVETVPGGVELSFFWNTNVDLRDGDTEVLLRATPDDRTPGSLGVGLPEESQPFRVDNNDEPILQLLTELFVTSTDERRGIPVPFRVTDEEGDVVEVVFQWRRPEDPFPDLPTGGAELDAILADPALRREHHICTAYPRHARGLVVPVDEITVRLPELAQGESWALGWELQGRTLELLRPSSIPAPISPSWPANPLVAPVAVVPLRDGLTAVVVDGVGSPRVREIELATGAVVREIGTLGPGIPSAAALERGGAAALVASDLGGLWHLDRIELASGAVMQLFASDGASPPPPVRGIASLGRNAALVTVGARLARIDYRDPLAPRMVTILDGLATPWGVVLDPLAEGRVYVAERDALVDGRVGRILAVELDSRQHVEIGVKSGGAVELERPEALALARDGARILALSSRPGGRQLIGSDLGGSSEWMPFTIGAPIEAGAMGLSSGADGLLVIAQPGANELLVGGGIQQRRTIVEPVMPPALHAQVDVPFSPAPRSGQRWRIALTSRLPARPAGAERAFAWDASTDVRSGGSTILRAVARDSEAGLVVAGRVPKRIRAPLDVEPIAVPGSTAADLDEDGDLDLVVAGFQAVELLVRFQTAPLVFGSPVRLGDVTTLNPTSVHAADLDGDGDLDLASSNGRQSGGTLALFFQDVPGNFDPVATVLASPDMVFPEQVKAADLDQDGDLDLISSNSLSSNVTVYLQTAPRVFAAAIVFDDDPASITAADLDGDGDTDLALSSRLYLQSTPGVFDPPLQLPDAVSTVADMDEDGDVDLVAGGQVYLQGAPGEFGPPVQLLPSGAVVRQAADVDGDGDLDLVTSSGVFFQEATGVFDPDPLATTGSAAADWNGDGDLDLVEGSGIFLQDGPGIFGSELLVETAAQTVANAAADLDADGDLDLVTNRGIHFQKAPGVFAQTPLGIGVGGRQSAADMDGDGDLEVLSTDSFNDDLRVFFQDSPGSFDPEPLVLDVPGEFPGSVSGSDPFFLAAADLDGDDDLDLASANIGSDDLTLFFQREPGSFDPVPLVLDVLGGAPEGSDSNPRRLVAADLDGDGDLDLASANAGGTFVDGTSETELTVFFQSAPGRFDAIPLELDTTPTGSQDIGASSITAADLDSDGDQDLASNNADLPFESGDGIINVFFQSAPGVFGPAPLALAELNVESSKIASVDLDGDGDFDLVSVNREGSFFGDGRGDLSIYLQTAPGIFDPTPLHLTTSGDWFEVLAADIDGDGDADLASGAWPSALSESDGLLIFLWGGR